MRKRHTVALIYDFDGTLSPGNMQEFGFIQAIGKDPETFWRRSSELSQSQDASEILSYMKLMLDEAKASNIQIRREDFKKFGSKIPLYDGVKEWFAMVNRYGESKGVNIEHYINSSGLQEMIEGSIIYHEFKKVFACSFLYENGVATWPAVAIDYTGKTQFIFKINKGVHSIRDHVRVNEYVPDKDRAVPFSSMIYFGDGATDIPCMKLVKQFGGHSIAVYDPTKRGARVKAEKLISENRVNFACPTDYTRYGKLYRVVTSVIDKIVADLQLDAITKV